jgi:hypothetical protein
LFSRQIDTGQRQRPHYIHGSSRSLNWSAARGLLCKCAVEKEKGKNNKSGETFFQENPIIAALVHIWIFF